VVGRVVVEPDSLVQVAIEKRLHFPPLPRDLVGELLSALVVWHTHDEPLRRCQNAFEPSTSSFQYLSASACCLRVEENASREPAPRR